MVSGANVLLIDEPTINLDPASTEDIPGALATFFGAVVLASRDVGVFTALKPERLINLLDSGKDNWNEGYEELNSIS